MEEFGVPKGDAECTICSTNWGMRLSEVVEQTEDHNTTSYPCLAEGGKENIVLYRYKVCPFCKGPKKDHIIKLVTMLATSLVGTNVPEVKIDHKEWVLLEFDVRLFMAGAATAYPELYQACLAIYL